MPHVAALVLLSGGWLLGNCRVFSLSASILAVVRMAARHDRRGTLFSSSLPATSRPQLHAN